MRGQKTINVTPPTSKTMKDQHNLLFIAVFGTPYISKDA
jgi:hypothetical protein